MKIKYNEDLLRQQSVPDKVQYTIFLELFIRTKRQSCPENKIRKLPPLRLRNLIYTYIFCLIKKRKTEYKNRESVFSLWFCSVFVISIFSSKGLIKWVKKQKVWKQCWRKLWIWYPKKKKKTEHGYVYCSFLFFNGYLPEDFDEFEKLWLQENVPLEEVFQALICDKHGLTTEAAQQRLAIFGYNKLEEKEVIRGSNYY